MSAPTVTKIIFAAIAIGITIPIWAPALRRIRGSIRRPERKTPARPVDDKRYKNLWVVDRDEP